MISLRKHLGNGRRLENLLDFRYSFRRDHVARGPVPSSLGADAADCVGAEAEA